MFLNVENFLLVKWYTTSLGHIVIWKGWWEVFTGVYFTLALIIQYAKKTEYWTLDYEFVTGQQIPCV